jgi:predicted N-formylglutamate amidohydrolase
MTIGNEEALLGAGDPLPVRITNPGGRSSFLLVGDHAGAWVPARLANLGLSAADLGRHIACDLGVSALGMDLATRLDATLIEQCYSRLVVDCNRARTAEDWIAPVSDGTIVPGNAGLAAGARTARHDEIFEPYHAWIAALIDERMAAGRAVVLVSLHSFTPTLAGTVRPWEVGVLHAGGSEGFARKVFELLQQESTLCVGDNEPYQMDETDYTVPRHAFSRGLAYVELEVRQDVLAAQAPAATDLIARALAGALAVTTA